MSVNGNSGCSRVCVMCGLGVQALQWHSTLELMVEGLLVDVLAVELHLLLSLLVLRRACFTLAAL